jgi:hypothetical protein
MVEISQAMLLPLHATTDIDMCAACLKTREGCNNL